MFRNLKVEKTEQGEYRVSFLTDHAALHRFIKFFRQAAEEAEYFYHRTLMAVRTADLTDRKPDPVKEEAHRYERQQLLRRHETSTGTARERFRRLRKELEEEGKPVSYDGLHVILRIAREEDRKGILTKIEQLFHKGIPIPAIAEKLGKSSSYLVKLARREGILMDKVALEENLAITIEALDREGLSLHQMSKHLGVPYPLLRRVALKTDLPQAKRLSMPIKEMRREREEQISALVAEGLSFAEIARMLRVTAGTVYHYAKRTGILNSKQRRELACSDRIAELAAEGMAPIQIAFRLRIPETMVTRCLSSRKDCATPKLLPLVADARQHMLCKT